MSQSSQGFHNPRAEHRAAHWGSAILTLILEGGYNTFTLEDSIEDAVRMIQIEDSESVKVLVIRFSK